MKKKFKETKVGKFLSEKGSKVIDIVGDFIPTVDMISNLISTDPNLTPEERQEAQRLVLEESRLEIEDRKSAREREIEIAKTGRKDVLQLSAGFTALLAFIIMILAVIFKMPGIETNIFHQLMGIIEGVALTVFAYYFGTSKGSKDKQSMIDNILKN